MAILGIGHVLLHGDSDLSQIAETLGSLSFLQTRFDGWAEERRQHGDDGDDYEQFDQREPPFRSDAAKSWH
jgi:hypothetical protein